MEHIEFTTQPDDYKHWSLTVDGDVARLTMKVDETHPLRDGYALKLNSYDLSVDIELADAVSRLRFEHPEAKVVVVTSGTDNCFCAGANIYMLGSSTHAFKVNFCKYTNETRLALEEACERQHYIAALNGVASGGGYELALACETIVLQDDGSSAVSFPETPLLAVLPGTGGLTRLVDKRKVRRDLADVFSTLAEGVRGRRAVEWRLVDDVYPRSKFDEKVAARAKEASAKIATRSGPGVKLAPLAFEQSKSDEGIVRRYRYVTLTTHDGDRTAKLTMQGPSDAPATTSEALREQGCRAWSLMAFRELDDALLQLRFNHPTLGLVLLETKGDAALVRAHDDALLARSGPGRPFPVANANSKELEAGPRRSGEPARPRAAGRARLSMYPRYTTAHPAPLRCG
jgi:benzoyl-CoA-dihydrodiol lyase